MTPLAVLFLGLAPQVLGPTPPPNEYVRAARMNEWRDGGDAVPLGLVRSGSNLFQLRDVPRGPEVLVPLAAFFAGDVQADRRLLAMRLDEDVPVRSVQRVVRWPASGTGVLVAEVTGAAEIDATALALARFAQQRLWERSGLLLSLVEDATGGLGPRVRDHVQRDQARWVLRFGGLDADPDATARTWSGPELTGGEYALSTFAVRGSNRAALERAYLLEPWFRDLPVGGETWPLDAVDPPPTHGR